MVRAVLVFLAFLGLLLALAAWRARRVVMRTALQQLRDLLQVDLRVDRVEVDLLSGTVDIVPVRIFHGDRPVLVTERITARMGLVPGTLRPKVESLEAHRPRLFLEKTPSGKWNLAEVLAPALVTRAAPASPSSPPPPSPPALPFESRDRAPGPPRTRPPRDPAPPLSLAGLPVFRLRRGQVLLQGPAMRHPLALEDAEVTLSPLPDEAISLIARGHIRGRGKEQGHERMQVDLGGRLVPGEVWTGELTATLADGDSAHLEGLLGSFVERTLARFTGSASLSGPLAAPRLAANLVLREGVVDLGARGRAAAADSSLRVEAKPGEAPLWTLLADRVELAAPQGAVLLRDLSARLATHRDRLEILEARTVSGAGTLSVTGTVGREPDSPLALTVTGGPVDAALLTAALASRRVRARGQVVVSAELSGTTSSPSVRLAAESPDLVLELPTPSGLRELPMGPAQARLAVSPDDLLLETLTATPAGARLSASGRMSATQEAGSVEVVAEDLPLGFLAGLVAAGPTPPVTGSLDARLSLSGSPGAARLLGSISDLHGVAGSGTRSLGFTGFSAKLMGRLGAGSELAIERFEGDLGGSRLVGRLQLSPDRASGELASPGLALGTLLRLAGRHELDRESRLATRIRFSHDPSGLEVEGDARSPELALVLGSGSTIPPAPPSPRTAVLSDRTPNAADRPGRTRLTDLELALRYSTRGEPFLEVRRGRARGFDGRVLCEGRIDLGTRPRMAFDLELEDIDAAAVSRFLDRDDLELSGRATLEGTLVGPPSTPELSVALDLKQPRLSARLGGKTLTLAPDELSGRFTVAPGRVELGPLRGKLGGGPFDLDFEARDEGGIRPWRLSLASEGVELARFAASYLDQDHDLSGSLEGSLLLHGRGAERTSVTGTGRLRVRGRVGKLASLDRAAARYGLRNLRGIDITTFEARLSALAGKLVCRDLRAVSSLGEARGLARIGLDGGLEGELKVALDRKILGPAHRALAKLEGGRWFNFDLGVGGTLAAPVYGFRTRFLGRRFVAGASAFAPADAPLTLVSGLKDLYRRKDGKGPAEWSVDLPWEALEEVVE